jgi:succinylglutamate desuccinylase
MKLLDDCDAMLDLHAYNEPEGDPFVMTETVGLEVADIFDVSIISTNWANEEPGTTDAYMCLRSKVGLCLECGPITKAAQYCSFAEKSILQFLSYYGMLEHSVPASRKLKRIIQATDSLVRTSEAFWLDPNLQSFQKLHPGQKFATHGKTEYKATKGDYIIFPRPNAPLGSEAFILGREQKHKP